MNINVSNSVPANIVGRDSNGDNAYADRLTSLLTAVKNSAETASKLTPMLASVTSTVAKFCETKGLTALVKGLTWVGNTAGLIPQISTHIKNAVQLWESGVKIMEHGVSALVYELMSLLKNQAFPIMDCWMNKVIDVGENVTMKQVLNLLVDCIADNKEIRQLFKEVTTSQ